MAIRPTIQAGNPILHQVADEVTDVLSKEVQQVTTDLIDTMRDEGLVGIAAPQIGESVRIFVTEVRSDNLRGAPADPLRVFINPVITDQSAELDEAYEGCGSVASAQLFGKVARARTVTVTATNQAGESFTLEAHDLLARIIQHEYDHLEGILFPEKITDMKSIMSREEYKKMMST